MSDEECTSEAAKAVLVVEIRDDVVHTHLKRNPGNLSYAQLARELHIAARHIARIPEGEEFTREDPHVEYIDPATMEQLDKELRDGQ